MATTTVAFVRDAAQIGAGVSPCPDTEIRPKHPWTGTGACPFRGKGIKRRYATLPAQARVLTGSFTAGFRRSFRRT
jgi:hypothetical protein